VSGEGINSRLCAVKILSIVLGENKNFDDIRDKFFTEMNISKEDRAFVNMLCLTTLRHLGRIDYAIAKFCTLKRDKKSYDLHNLLRISFTQIFLLRIPDYAAVNSAVNIAKKLFPHYKNMVNGVLRKAIRELDFSAIDILQGFPQWIIDGMSPYFGKDEARKIAAAFLSEPEIYFANKEGETLQDDYDLQNLPREIWVQDIAAQIPARLFSNIKGKKIIDLCAAPGGKTMQLIAAGANVIAVDISLDRVERIESNLHRTGMSCEIVIADAASWQPANAVDAVLVDAPCSAIGTLRKNPEGIWLKSASDLLRLNLLQKNILINAAKMLKNGGELIYCTCSLHASEGRGIISEFLHENENWELEQEIITHPAQEPAHDGFYISKLRLQKN
jgi:16S rRNA (cytosine967-C5)-methyltransferase